MIMYFITFLRHGESEGNLAGLLQGQIDYPLTASGMEQARALASFWKSVDMEFDLVISSPLLRASQTAEIIANSLKVPIEFDPAWKERNFGSLQGASLQEIDRRNPPIDFFHPYEPIGGDGESQLDLYVRASQALQNIIRHPAGSYLVVSHGGILNKALYGIMAITPQGHYNSPIFHFGNTGYAQFRYNSSSRQWAVISLNSQLSQPQTEGIQSWKQD
jgi:2,3-bisphosphoglycerate-dependent phosphoglycerate mutase